MELGTAVTMVFYAAVFFFCGWGWGQWWCERQIRAEQGKLMKGRITVSMPMEPEDAASTMRLLAALVDEAERTRKAGM